MLLPIFDHGSNVIKRRGCIFKILFWRDPLGVHIWWHIFKQILWLRHLQLISPQNSNKSFKFTGSNSKQNDSNTIRSITIYLSKAWDHKISQPLCRGDHKIQYRSDRGNHKINETIFTQFFRHPGSHKGSGTKIENTGASLDSDIITHQIAYTPKNVLQFVLETAHQ